MTLDERLTEIEASIAKITNTISLEFPTDDEIRAVRIEIFGALKTQKDLLDQIERALILIEQRIT